MDFHVPELGGLVVIIAVGIIDLEESPLSFIIKIAGGKVTLFSLPHKKKKAAAPTQGKDAVRDGSFINRFRHLIDISFYSKT